MAAFMRDALIAADLLRDTVHQVDLGRGTGSALQQLLIVFEDHPEGVEYEINPVSEDADGTRVYTAASHWLTDEYADERSGPWSLLAVLCGILVSLHREGEINLPRLPAQLGDDG